MRARQVGGFRLYFLAACMYTAESKGTELEFGGIGLTVVRHQILRDVQKLFVGL